MAKQQPDGNQKHFSRKPSELPAYTPLHSFDKVRPVSHLSHESEAQNSPVRTFLESGIRLVRTDIQNVLNGVTEQTDQLRNYYETGKAHTQQTIDYLNEPQNILPRSGAIALGGLAGLVFAARGGLIRKFLYTSIGGGAIASLCYPTQAENVAHITLQEARKGLTISYNFVKGIKPGDDVPFEPLKNFPTSLEDVKFMFWDTYDEVRENFFPGNK